MFGAILERLCTGTHIPTQSTIPPSQIQPYRSHASIVARCSFYTMQCNHANPHFITPLHHEKYAKHWMSRNKIRRLPPLTGQSSSFNDIRSPYPSPSKRYFQPQSKGEYKLALPTYAAPDHRPALPQANQVRSHPSPRRGRVMDLGST